MANEQGLLKQTIFAKQTSGLGVPAATGGKIKRRTSAVFSKMVDTYESNEIVSHQQSTGANAGIVKTSGKLDGLISPSTFSEQFASLLRKDNAATTPGSAIATLTVTSSGTVNDWTLTRGAGDFLADGIKVGDVIRLTAATINVLNGGTTTGAAKNILVLSITATVIIARALNGTALFAQAITNCTVTVMGKKTWTPISGHTNDYWTVEEWYSGISRSEVFRDCKIAKADVTVPATGNATVSFDVPGLGRTEGASQYMTSPTVETSTAVLTAVNGVICIFGGAADNTVQPIPVTGIQFSIDGHIQPGEAEVGTNQIGDHIRGEISVSGQFTAKFSSTNMQQLFTGQTLSTIIVVLTDGAADAANFVSFVIPQVKLFGDTPDDGEAKEIVRTYPFTAQIPSALVGGPALAHNQTIISIQDSQAP